MITALKHYIVEWLVANSVLNVKIFQGRFVRKLWVVFCENIFENFLKMFVSIE